MKTRTLTVTAILVCFVLGCNQEASQPAPESSGAGVDAPTNQVALQAKASQFESPALATPPPDVIRTFLTALRDGDEKTTSTLLTDVARQETSKHDLAVTPPGTPSAKFNIGQVEYIVPQHDGAHVTSTWTQNDEQGNRITYEVVWVMRRQSDGWKIAGLAASFTPNEPPVFLNFEDPDDMIEKQRWAERIAADYDQNQPIQQAQQPQPTSNTLR